MPFTVVAAPALQSNVTDLGAHLSPTAARWGQGVRASDCAKLACYKLCGIVGQRKGFIKPVSDCCLFYDADGTGLAFATLLFAAIAHAHMTW